MSIAASGARSASVGLVKIKADGSKVNLGIMSFRHKNPVIHWVVNAWIAAKVAWFKMRGIL